MGTVQLAQEQREALFKKIARSYYIKVKGN